MEWLRCRGYDADLEKVYGRKAIALGSNRHPVGAGVCAGGCRFRVAAGLVPAFRGRHHCHHHHGRRRRIPRARHLKARYRRQSLRGGESLPRQWYVHALERPQVEVADAVGGEAQPYLAVPLTGSELARVAEAYSVGFVFRVLTGFPPRRFLRLDPA